MPEKKQRFIQQLAHYLCCDTAHKSIELQLGKQHAKEWAMLRAVSPIIGWISEEEAVIKLTEFLN